MNEIVVGNMNSHQVKNKKERQCQNPELCSKKAKKKKKQLTSKLVSVQVTNILKLSYLEITI